MEIGLVLEEVQVPPSERVGIVGFAIGGGADRARETTASWKIQIDVETAGLVVKTAMVDLPGWLQPQGLLE